jgi:LysM repeat protein
MTRKQMALLIIGNAVISALISVAVVAAAVLLLRDRTGVLSPAPAASIGLFTTTAEPGRPDVDATPLIHTVRAGDTVTGLALQYDVPAEDIIAANQLQNPNFLELGMKLIIPVSGVPLATVTLTPAPTATETPIPFEPPSAQMTATAAAKAGATVTPLPTPLPITGELQIEITEVIKPGEIQQEGVTITNRGDRLADMSGWTLSDAAGSSYIFPSFRLWAGSVTVFSRAGQDGSPPAALYWGRSQPVWSSGEQATLKDAVGKTVATYVVGQ